MEEKEKKEKSQKTEKGFKTVQNPSTYKNYKSSESTSKSNTGFGKSVLLPFFSGIIGCGIVLRYLFWCSIYSLSNITK